MQKNVASQKLQFFAFIPSTGLPKTGDAANITIYVSKDHGAVTALTDTSATEMDATNAKGVYVVDVSQTETNADELAFTGKSSTSDVSIVPRFITTTPANFNKRVIDTAGLGDANVVKVGPTGSGTAQTARDIGASVLLSSGTGTGQVILTSGVVSADTTKWNGTAVAPPDTAGYPKTTVKVGTGTGEISLSSGAVKLQTGLKKNQALLNFPFQMTDSTNHNPATGLTVSVSVSLDGAASFTSVGTATEMANGWYQIDLTAGNMNGDTIAFKAIATGADDLGITIITEP